jgi:hypothetical protein
MPPKQQKLSFAGSSSSSDKRPRDEASPTPSAGQDSPDPQYANAVFMTRHLPGGVQVPAKYITPIFEELERICSNFSLEIESLQNTIRGQDTNITKLQQQVNELVSRPPPIPTFVEVGKTPVQPHSQQIPPQPRAPRLNKNIPGNATTTPTPTPAPNKPPTATSAKVDADAGFTTVTNKKKKKPITLLPPPQPTAERKLFHQTPPLRNLVLQEGPCLFPPTANVRLVSVAPQGNRPHLSYFLTDSHQGFVERKRGGSHDG